MNFNSPYNREEYVKFFRDQFLPEDFLQSSENISPGFSAQYTQQVTKIGRSNSLDLTVYEIRHASENDPRVSISKESFRLLADYGQKRALVLFISDTLSNYRLSLVTIDLKWEEGKRVQREYSNPRRLSFFLGPDAKVHTPQQYLLKPGRIKNFDDLKKRFSIEVVNKDFYTEIAILFTKLTGGTRKIGSKTIEVKKELLEFPSPDDTKRKEFAVRLIGRLVFCWFLKKKRSKQNVPLLPEELLSIDAVDKNRGYYHNILEPLFFGVLNAPMAERAKHFATEPWTIIPFLNGGLFTAHEDDYYKLTFNGVSEHLNTLIVPDEWLKELLKIFETYNFTIDENTPVDVELAIEPEMLGRIFENLLAEINPETGETARKATGSYYTPRPIVEYMVDESLKQYLLTKTKLPEEKISALLSYAQETPALTDAEKDEVLDSLNTIRIIDPACGSGAFPMSILQKILLILQKIDHDSRKWLEKKTAGIPDTLEGREFKRKLATEDWDYVRKLGIIRDAIYGVDIQSVAVEISKLRCFLSLMVNQNVDDSEDNRGVEHLPNLEFKFVCANSLIGLPRLESQQTMFEANQEVAELRKLRSEYLNSYGVEKTRIEHRFREIQSKMFEHSIGWGGRDTQTLRLSQWNPFSEEPCGWFDPEWMFGIKDGFDIVIANPPYGAEFKSEEYDALQKTYTYYDRQKNSASFFVEMATRLVLKNGVVIYIIPKSISFSEGWGKTRQLISDINRLHAIVDVSKAFEEVLLEQVIVCFIRNQQTNYDFYAGEAWELYVNINNKINNKLIKELDLLPIYVDPIKEKLLQKIKLNSIRLGEISKTFRGLPLQSKLAENGASILRGKNVGKYIIYRKLDKINLNADLKNSKKVREILRPKIVSQNIVAHVMSPTDRIIIMATVDKTPFLTLDTVMNTFLNDETFSLEYIVAILNSRIASWFYYWFVYNRAIRTMHFDKYYIGKMPIPIISNNQQRQFSEIVEEILETTKSEDYQSNESKQAEVKKLETQIDQMVYGLYGLTADEIAIVEGHSKAD